MLVIFYKILWIHKVNKSCTTQKYTYLLKPNFVLLSYALSKCFKIIKMPNRYSTVFAVAHKSFIESIAKIPQKGSKNCY